MADIPPTQPPGDVPPPPPPPGSPPPPGYSQPGYGQPSGYSPTPEWTGPPLADYGQRVIAYLIDWAISVVLIIVVVILSAILGAISDALGLLVVVVGYLGVFAYQIWNLAYLQGTNGQTLGKMAQGISLVKEETLQPIGIGMVIVRYLVAGALAGVTCGIYGLLDILWPLWDPKRQRLTDKILKNVVIKSQARALNVQSFNPFSPTP